MTIYFSHPSGGPCWSRDRGYHTPAPLPFPIFYSEPQPRKTLSDEYRCFIGDRSDDISEGSHG